MSKKFIFCVDIGISIYQVGLVEKSAQKLRFCNNIDSFPRDD